MSRMQKNEGNEMINVERMIPRDRLSAIIPLIDWEKVDIYKPGLFRILIDSNTAKNMLSLNVKNRIQRRNAVDYLKNQIRNGEWRDDHPQPVIFSDSGRLIDGQHRLQAIYELGIDRHHAVIIRVETGARDEVREYLDTGVPRTLNDRVELVEDLVINKILSQLCTFEMQLKTARKRPSPDEAREWFASHSESAVFIARNHKRDKAVGRMQVAYAAMEYYELDKRKAKQFYPALFVFDSEIQQARALRDYLLRSSGTAAMKENTSAARLDVYYRSVSAMKSHRDGREIKLLRRAEW